MSEEDRKSLKEFVYDSLIDAILSTLNKLNLTTLKESELDGKTVSGDLCFEESSLLYIL